MDIDPIYEWPQKKKRIYVEKLLNPRHVMNGDIFRLMIGPRIAFTKSITKSEYISEWGYIEDEGFIIGDLLDCYNYDKVENLSEIWPNF